MGSGRVMLWASIGLPIIWIVTDFIIAILMESVVSDATFMGIDAAKSVALAVSIVILAAFIKHATRLVRR